VQGRNVLLCNTGDTDEYKPGKKAFTLAFALQSVPVPHWGRLFQPVPIAWRVVIGAETRAGQPHPYWRKTVAPKIILAISAAAGLFCQPPLFPYPL